MSLSGKFLSIYGTLVIIFGGLLGWISIEFRQYSDELSRFHTSMLSMPEVIQQKRSELRTLNLIISSSSESRIWDYLNRTINSRIELDARLKPLLEKKPFDFDQTESRIALSKLIRLDRQLAQKLRDLTLRKSRPTRSALQPLRTRLINLDQSLELFGIDVQHAINKTILTFRKKKTELVWTFIACGWCALLVGMVALWLTRRLLAPLRSLKQGIEKLSDGEYGHRIVVNRTDELGMIAQEFNDLAEGIAHRNDQLASQQRSLLHREQLATVGKMSAQITHELRNPLSSIGLNSELLLEEFGQNLEEIDLPASQELLRNITKEVDRLRDITEEYLQFARLPRPEKTAVRLDILGQEILEFMSGELEQAKVKWRTDAGSSPVSVMADPNQLRSAIINLVRNAKEATSPNGHLILRTRTVGHETRLEIVDDGPGIPSSIESRLFDPFVSTKPQGTGLGLALVRQVMESQGGKVELLSKPGEGTCARIALPTETKHTPDAP